MTTSTLYPLRFEPILKPTIWGGNKISAYKGMGNAEEENIGESWEISGVQGNVSVVSNGHLAGKTLNELIDRYRELFVGEAVYQRFGNEFPLLIKFIDAREDLSIQVHPNDEVARKQHQSNGKTEFWYIIDAQEDASLYSGFNKKVTPEEVRQHVENNTICSILNKESVQKNNAYFLPAGRVHSIGAGLFIAEIQQTSDATYRLWDFDRIDKNGNKRELHLDLALDAIDYRFYRQYKNAYKPCVGRPVKLQECSYFTTNLIEADTFIKFDYKRIDSFVIWICLEGSAIFASSKKHNQKIKQGETILFPACDLPTALIPETNNIRLLEVYVGWVRS